MKEANQINTINVGTYIKGRIETMVKEHMDGLTVTRESKGIIVQEVQNVIKKYLGEVSPNYEYVITTNENDEDAMNIEFTITGYRKD